jgi:mRNA interferase MazF
VVIAQGEVWWADLPAPVGSEAGFRRPVVIVQGDDFNMSALHTTVVVPLTSNVGWAGFPGNVLLAAQLTGLGRDSVAEGSQIMTVDKDLLTDRVGKLSGSQLGLVFAGIDVVLGRF